jgi:Mrp family chromosome partitioning ATPase
LEQFSAGGKDLRFDQIEKLISPTGVDNVDIIGCQGGDYTPSEILPKDHLLNHLNEFLKTYDFILMEGAPLNGFTDTKELSQYAEGIVAIFSAKAEIKSADKESIKYFQTVKDKFLGAVLNKIDNKDFRL